MSRNSFVELLYATIEKHIHQHSFNVDYLARLLGMNRILLYRRVKCYIGCTPSQYIEQIRIKRAKHLLLHTQKKVKDIGEELGYKDNSHFTKVFKRQTQLLPLEFRYQYSVYYQ